MGRKPLGTKFKALEINLNHQIYGTFAEIGAGQEVAREFFVAGGASGTVAQTISAYDMVFSDSIYGKEASGRYVCESRVNKMLTHEYDILVERLKNIRGKETCFFVFADTVATKAYDRNNEAHGWLGVRFQLTPESEPNQVVLHVRMLDDTSLEQQMALGIIGVNLVHACFNFHHSREDFIDALMDNLNTKRIEIDVIRFTGKDYSNDDNRLLNLELVKRGYTNAVIFDQKGQIILPSDIFYKKSILAVRGSYRPPTLVNLDTIKKGQSNFLQDTGEKAEDLVTVAEITINNLENSGEFSNVDFLARVDMLGALGQVVLISNYPEYFRLSSYFARFTKKHIGIVLGLYNFKQIFDAEYNQKLEGGILESLGLLFRNNVKVYVYPYKNESDRILLTSKNLDVDNKLLHLYNYLKENKQIKDIADFDASLLHIYSRKVLNMLIEGQPGWEVMVPPTVADTIKKKKLFGKT